MFDKGLSLLCAFGMPGYKHPDGLLRFLKKCLKIFIGFFRC
jgi:hypothetical protein